MQVVPRITPSGFRNYGGGAWASDSDQLPEQPPVAESPAPFKTSTEALLQVHQLRVALLGIQHGRISRRAIATRAVASTRESGLSCLERQEAVHAISEFASCFNALFDDQHRQSAEPCLQDIRNALETAIVERFPARSKRVATPIGIEFDFSKSSEGVFRFSEAVKKQFSQSLKTARGAMECRRFFFGGTHPDAGFAEPLLAILRTAERDLSLELGPIGIFVDLQV